MLVFKNNLGLQNKKYVVGRGFVDNIKMAAKITNDVVQAVNDIKSLYHSVTKKKGNGIVSKNKLSAANQKLLNKICNGKGFKRI